MQYIVSLVLVSKMDFFHIIFISIATTLILIILAFITLILKIFIGKSIQNPQHAPVVGTVFNQLFYFSKLHDYHTEVALKHPTFRFLAPDHSELYTTDTRNIEYILKTNFDNYSKGESNKDIITDLFGDGIFAVDGVMWKQQRKLASFEFSTRVLRDFSCSVFRKNAVKLVGVVSKFSEANKDFDVQNLLMQSALDSIFKVGFGVDLNCLEGSSKEGSAFIKAFDDSNAFTYWRYVDPIWKLKRFFNIGCEASLRNNIRLINDFVLNLISKRREQLETNQHCNEREDILSRFLIESKKDARMNDRYLMDIILNFLLAGKDSSANTLSWFFYMLCKNPLVQEKVVSEIENVVGKQENGSRIQDFVDRIDDQVLEKMHYLHAALTETLRLYPAVPVDGRVADMDDTLPDGFKLKKGDGVYYISYAMGRMAHIWGDDAYDFKPERWLNDNGVFQPESPFKFIAFHAGPRICLGKDFAYRQMKIVSIALLHFFVFKLADESRKVTYRTMFTLHIDGGLHLLATPRSS
ncbi:putative abieta-7,13-dien-18-ol hydroxylase [Helianthus annuus]|nr:putative abieta-7,13-dien-18-ol hydroxylase [Helianthus annuus]